MTAHFDCNNGRIAVVVGTRSDGIKLQPLIDKLGSRAWTIEGGDHGRACLADSFGLRRAGAVVVRGDSDVAVAAALAANSVGVPLVYVGAGLRSFDETLADEKNRVLIDHLSDVCAAPTVVAAGHLLAEGVAPERVSVTGSTTVETVTSSTPTEVERLKTRRRLRVQLGRYVLATVDRPENVDDPKRLAAILDALGRSSVPVVLPMHDRTAHNVERFGLSILLDGVHAVDPLPHRELIGLLDDAAVVVTDSGGIQEEVSVLGRFAVVLRRSTERPEVLGTFAELVTPDVLAGRIAHHLSARTGGYLRGLVSPFGDGSASTRIARLTTSLAGC